jgi:nitroreductase
VHHDRRRRLGWSLTPHSVLLKVTGKGRHGGGGERNFKFFDAPVGLFVTTDSYLARGNWADVGMYIQTIMLAAKGFGPDTCAQAAWISYQEPVFRHLSIPDDQVLISGMSIGYADPDAIENTLVSDREGVENVAHYRGFD